MTRLTPAEVRLADLMSRRAAGDPAVSDAEIAAAERAVVLYAAMPPGVYWNI